MSSMEELIQRIEKCNICNAKFKGLVITESKPYLEFNVYEKWIPEQNIKCLFIGESPPRRDTFFYDYQKENTLRRNMFSLLEISNYYYEGLCEFKRRGFLLTDAVKCRVNKEGRSIPKRVIENCSKIFEYEIKLLSEIKNVKKIVILGSTALKALTMIGFHELNGYSVEKDCGKTLKSNNFEIFLCTLPFARTKNYWNTTKAKEKLKSFIEKEL
jgi:uracil-DNA glycosylase